MKRRQFMTGTLATAFLASCRSADEPPGPAPSAPLSSRRKASAPNILVILVDEMRAPAGFPTPSLPGFAAVIPNMVGLWSRSACFTNHLTAVSDCSPSRASLLTGLYGQQHCLFTTRTGPSDPSLQTAFPTFGTALSGALGYDATWFGKWHLSSLPATCAGASPLAAYGFGGGTCPDPTGMAGQGARQDASIAQQFTSWLARRRPGKPWCTTVSFVNPHDVQWFWSGSQMCTQTYTIAGGVSGSEAAPPAFGYDASYFAAFGGNPGQNYENPFATATPKPSFQRAFADFTMNTWGPVSYVQGALDAGDYAGSATVQPFSAWYTLLQLYEFCQGLVDVQIGKVLSALGSSPFADDTIVVFTADHGEYASAHGMRGKGGGAYEEVLRVPLAVYDPTGAFVASPATPRTGLTSSVDLAPLLMTLGDGGDTSLWQPGGAYGYLSSRLDVSSMLASASAPGRAYALYSTDEYLDVDPSSCPTHVATYRTATGKLSAYSHWVEGGVQIDASQPQELEYYDLVADPGELDNAPTGATAAGYAATLLGSSGSGGLVTSEMQSTTGFSAAMLSARSAAITAYYALLAAGEPDGGVPA